MIKDKILKLRQRIPEPVTLVAVSKGRDIAQIKEAVSAGITDIGENRVQEALAKYTETREELRGVKWHMVGHLQTNKVKEAVLIFDLIHSVDSFRLAAEIDNQAAKINKIQNLLIEVNVSGEESKYGVSPQEAPNLTKTVSQLKNVRLEGLMAIAPIVDEPGKTRPYFRLLRELRDKANRVLGPGFGMQVLSMGMSGDYEIAIEEGSTMVRLGRAIFE